MTDTTLTRVQRVLHEVLGAPIAKITAEADLIEDLDADSLDTVEIVMDLETEFGVEFRDEDFQVDGLTVAGIVNLVEARL